MPAMPDDFLHWNGRLENERTQGPRANRRSEHLKHNRQAEGGVQRRTVMLGLAGITPLALSGKSPAQSPDRNREQMVRQLVDLYAKAWNESDMTAMAALYMADVHWVNIVGMHWQGREEVDYAHRALFDQSFNGVRSVPEEIESIMPLPGGGAVAVVRWAV